MRKSHGRRGWTIADIPDQTGRIAFVTGATTGLGFETASALVGAGAEVVIAARNMANGQAAVRRIKATYPDARVTFATLDLASLASIAAFADAMDGRFAQLDLLINNAGLASPRVRLTTADGFEVQFGTNFLGHFALDAHLLPLLRRASAPRVVSVSSIMHKYGTIDFDDLMSARRYSPVRSYNQSKLANLIFARELQRRSDAQGWNLSSVAAHPGIERTELVRSRPGQPAMRFNAALGWLAPLFTGTALDGALPSLFAATSPDAVPGGYYGPTGLGEIKGPTGPARSTPESRDLEIAARLWRDAERLTKVPFPAP